MSRSLQNRNAFSECCPTRFKERSFLPLALCMSPKRFGEDSQPRVSESFSQNLLSRSANTPAPFSLPSSPPLSSSACVRSDGSARLFAHFGPKMCCLRFTKNTYAESIDGREEEAGGWGCDSGRGASFCAYSSEDAAVTQTPLLPPALGPTTGQDRAPAPPARAAPPGLRIAPGASPRCSRPSSAALLPASRPPCPAPAAVWCHGRAQTPEPFSMLQNGL